jgi:hypothetical protein
MAVEVDKTEACLVLSDIGVTLRTLLAVAAEAYPSTRRRRWALKYKDAIIGRIQIKDDHLRGKVFASDTKDTGQNLTGNEDANSSTGGYGESRS